MVACVIDEGWTIEATAERFQVDAKTVRKWRDRFLAEGDAGLQDRSSRPHRSPNRTLARSAQAGAASASQASLGRRPHRPRDRPGRLDGASDPATRRLRPARLAATGPPREPVVRYQRERPGELIHVDVKKIAGIPAGGGWRTPRPRQRPPPTATQVGYRFIHTALDDRTRLAYSEILDDEQAVTAAGSGAARHAGSPPSASRCERVITDNGSCYQSGLWHAACADTGTTVKKTRPHRPQTNGKVERFHRILLEEWAYIRPWTSDQQRTPAYDGFIHFYNHHRSHGALGWSTPAATLNHSGTTSPANTTRRRLAARRDANRLGRATSSASPSKSDNGCRARFEICVSPRIGVHLWT